MASADARMSLIREVSMDMRPNELLIDECARLGVNATDAENVRIVLMRTRAGAVSSADIEVDDAPSPIPPGEAIHLLSKFPDLLSASMMTTTYSVLGDGGSKSDDDETTKAAAEAAGPEPLASVPRKSPARRATPSRTRPSTASRSDLPAPPSLNEEAMKGELEAYGLDTYLLAIRTAGIPDLRMLREHTIEELEDSIRRPHILSSLKLKSFEFSKFERKKWKAFGLAL
jgi:hypothetical protein